MCNCGGGKARGAARQAQERWRVTLPNGLKVTKGSEAEARSYASKHLGPDGKPAKVEKAGG